MATSKRKDFTQTALDVVRQATGEVAAPAPSKKPESGRKAPTKPASKVTPLGSRGKA
jgi:hypothetical protein